MTDAIDTDRAREVSGQLAGQITEAVAMKMRFEALREVLDSEVVFTLPHLYAREFIDEVGLTSGSLQVAALVAEGADAFGLLDSRLDALEAGVNDGVGFSASDEDRRQYYEGQWFSGYRGFEAGVQDDGTLSDQEYGGISRLLRTLPPDDAADYWASLPEEERRRMIRRSPDHIAEFVLGAGGVLTADEQADFESASARYVREHGDRDFGAVGNLQPGDEIDVLGPLGNAATLIETGATVVVSINGASVAGHFVAEAAGKAGTVIGVGGVALECRDGVDAACAAAGAIFVVDTIGSAVLTPVVYNAVKYGAIGVILLVGLAQEDAPDIHPDWVGAGGAPGVLPYDSDDVVGAPTTGRNDGGAGNGQAGRVMADSIGDYCRSHSDEQVCGWGN